MLHNRRTRLAKLAELEAAGQSFWTESFESPLRVKIVQIIRELSEGQSTLTAAARSRILREEGQFYLCEPAYEEVYDFEFYVLNGPDEMMPTVIEAWASVANDENIQFRARNWTAGRVFIDYVNMLLREHRISYDLVGEEMIPLASRELHVEVVEPVLQLLASSKNWQGVETAYQSALTEIAKGDAADAVTDAGTALQEALKLLGCTGNALGPLIKSARQLSIIAAHDEPMLDAIEKVASWVSADRSVTGDAHNSSPAQIEDAWFIVHIVGALLLRLNKQTRRN